MTFTVNRNLVILVVALVVLGIGGYVIGTRMGDSPPATTEVTGDPTTAALPPAAQPGLEAPAAAPADNAPRIDMASFKAAFDEQADMLIVDVRTPDGFASGHIPGAINIPEAEVGTRMAEFPKDKRIVLYCA